MRIEDKIKTDISLAPITTFKIGGKAKFYIEIVNKDELLEIFNWITKNNERYMVLGGGSNILVSDQGFNGIVIKPVNREMRVMGERIQAGAGDFLPQAVRTSTGNELTGLEWAIGIPGTIGGAVRGNAGAYGKSISGNVENVEVFDLKKKKFYLYSNRDCRFSYRHSIFKDINTMIIWSVLLKLERGVGEEINRTVAQNLNARICSQPKLPSAGSVFKNFLVEEVKNANPELALLAEKENKIKGGKIAAGWVIGQLDIAGKKIGGAKVSLEHNNFIVNTGNATAEDVITLISYVKLQVRDNFNLQLFEEISYIGFD